MLNFGPGSGRTFCVAAAGAKAKTAGSLFLETLAHYL
jgi:hypothetical protein